jgi:hypothetical protein
LESLLSKIPAADRLAVVEHLPKCREHRDVLQLRSTISKNKWLLQDLATSLSKRPIAEITAAEILQLLQRIEKSGRRDRQPTSFSRWSSGRWSQRFYFEQISYQSIDRKFLPFSRRQVPAALEPIQTLHLELGLSNRFVEAHVVMSLKRSELLIFFVESPKRRR